jgi:hypothetical protein
MGHHHREETVSATQAVDTENVNAHPFLATNDLTYLSIILPLLSEPGKQLISFFINFGNSKPANSTYDPVNLLKQLAPKIENSGLKEILPSLLTLLSNPENKAALNPTVLSSLLSGLGGKKEAEPAM